ncbi:MAG: glycerate kinase [Bacteroidota bacterium]
MGIEHTAAGLFQAAVAGAQPPALLRDVRLAGLLDRAPSAFQRIVLVGAGKASMAMAGVLEEQLGAALHAGLVVVPHGYRASFPEGPPAPQRVEVAEAGHPVPDAAGVRAAQRTLDLAADLGADDLLLVALSGGGSALWPAFAGGIALDEAQTTFRLLLHSGADIHAMNTVRRQLSRIKGGGLARTAHPATVLTLVISDVVGDDLATIASGPTVPDPTTRADALAVLDAFGLRDRVPASVLAHLRGNEVRQDASAFERVQTVLFGSNRDALVAAQREAERLGYAVVLHEGLVEGEARDVGRRLARQALALDVDRPTCLLWGGETTVTVTGDGRGGRNQELALAAALELDGIHRDIVLLSGGTDGIDGPTDAAGAWATPQTAARARARGLSPEDHLARNDAYAFFDALGQLLKPGPTHTNVMDVQVALVHPA